MVAGELLGGEGVDLPVLHCKVSLRTVTVGGTRTVGLLHDAVKHFAGSRGEFLWVGTLGFGDGIEERLSIEEVDPVEGDDRDLQAVAHGRMGDAAADADYEIEIAGVRLCSISIDELLVVCVDTRHKDVGLDPMH